ncbi:hypothetical protein DFP72DRAFT_1078577 [Ephemerocybe angulata]|uniref:GAT domain-containing protein n=1 Tax=Ephemerocybe angulata TaxID=980116 RepID=A0A8H6HCC1_9AGAR|nr:hypothetical protein DFP72DRAFT_1078577 [Tulosesus angulatus]
MTNLSSRTDHYLPTSIQSLVVPPEAIESRRNARSSPSTTTPPNALADAPAPSQTTPTSAGPDHDDDGHTTTSAGAVLSSPSQLNAWSSSSCSQLEKDRQAQSAMLQELIRQGTPRNLAAAQEPVMKSLAGANPEAKPDYSRAEGHPAERDVDNVDTSRGEKFTTGEAYDRHARKCRSWISDAQNDDPESLDTFLQINDQINSVVNRYEAFKKGDYSIAGTIPAELAHSAQPTSLIDFDDSETAPAAANANPANDLAGLFGGASSSSSPPAPQQPSVVSPLQLHSELRALAGYNNGPPGNLFGSPSSPQSTATPPAAIRRCGGIAALGGCGYSGVVRGLGLCLTVSTSFFAAVAAVVVVVGVSPLGGCGCSGSRRAGFCVGMLECLDSPWMSAIVPALRVLSSVREVGWGMAGEWSIALGSAGAHGFLFHGVVDVFGVARPVYEARGSVCVAS